MPSSTSHTGIQVKRLTSSTSRLLWSGARCCTSTKAMPGAGPAGTPPRKASKAANPPAEAPIPTTGKATAASGTTASRTAASGAVPAARAANGSGAAPRGSPGARVPGSVRAGRPRRGAGPLLRLRVLRVRGVPMRIYLGEGLVGTPDPVPKAWARRRPCLTGAKPGHGARSGCSIGASAGYCQQSPRAKPGRHPFGTESIH